jgi:DNA-binding NtrC family response regulator
MEQPQRETLIQQGLVTQGAQRSSPPRQWRCRIVSGAEAGRSALLGNRPLVIGADGSCDLCLHDATVSRRHAELRVEARGVMLRDLGSTNGTTCNGARVTEVVLSSDATFSCGETKLQLSAIGAPPIPPSERIRFGSLVGQGLLMREVFAALELASPTEATMLIQGESGTGKEGAARAIHDHSDRAKGPFVVVDCSAAADDLVGSQLFGHKRGAFTGATTDRAGAFVSACDGTLFLDELGELSPTSQAKLLRALEQKQVTPLGSDRPVEIDTRVVAATNRDLRAMVEAGTFRFDLYHRLAVVHLQLPPLRDHLEDLPLLISHFYEGRGVQPGPIEGSNLELLRQYSWPGNVRELRNVLERGWALSGGATSFSALRLWIDTGGPRQPTLELLDTHLCFKEAKASWVGRFERRYLEAVFEAHGRNVTQAAGHAGINRRHFRELLKKYGLYDSR